MLKFTPLEFETSFHHHAQSVDDIVKIYSVGVWNKISDNKIIEMLKLKFTPLEFETFLSLGFRAIYLVKIYSVGVWNKEYNEMLDSAQMR